MRILLLFLLLVLPAQAQDLLGHGGPVRALAMLPGGTLASAGFDAAIIWWDPVAGRALHVARWHAGAVNALAALPEGTLASAGEDGRIALWPAGGADAPRQVLRAEGAPIAALAAAPDGTLAAGGWDGSIHAYAPDGTAQLLGSHDGPVTALAWRQDGVLLSAGQDGLARAWTGGGPVTLAQRGLPRTALAALPDTAIAALPGGSFADGGIDGMVQIGPLRLAAGDRPVVALAAAPGLLAAATAGGAITLWSLPEGRLLHRLDGPGLPVWSLAFAPDAATLWTGGQDRRIRRWLVANGAALGPLVPEPLGATAPDAEAFRACAGCHAVTAEAPPLAGPSLHHLFGRRMGSLPGYAYSPRLAQADVVWSPATLAQLFTEGPDVMLPGTRMPVQRLQDPDELAALLRYLEQATQ
jgi:cytochrome c